MANNQASNTNHRFRLFVGCIVALLATSFGFAVRGQLLGEWSQLFNLTNEQVGYIQGAGLFPFAITIILFSLIVDKIGYGVSMAIAFGLHLVSAVVTLCAPLAGTEHASFVVLYVGTLLFALGNGTVEAAINPATATLYPKEKTKYLSILHAGWPAGLFLGAILGIVMGNIGGGWQLRIALIILPMLVYGVILLGQKFPVHERVAAGVSYLDMLREFGWGSSLIVFFLVVAGVNQILLVLGIPAAGPLWWLLIAIALTIPFGAYVKSFGRPMFVFLLLVMCLVATTELGGDSWMQKIIGAVSGETEGALFFAWMALIMFVLRFYAGPLVHAFSPLGLLAISGAVACIGLVGLSWAGGMWAMFVVATIYGLGKTYFWPTMLGVTAEQFPKGGALAINAIAGVGMIFVGTIGNPSIGTVVDQEFLTRMEQQNPKLVEKVTTEKDGLWMEYQGLDQEKLNQLPEEKQAQVQDVVRDSQQITLGWLGILPGVMVLCYLGLILYFRSKGGYEAQELTGHTSHSEEYGEGAEGPYER